MIKPTDDQIDIAIQWLYENEGEGEEGEACKLVAQWLGDKLENSQLRRIARQAKVPIKMLRAKLMV